MQIKQCVLALTCGFGMLATAPSWASAPAVQGWPSGTIAMGSVINGGSETSALALRPVYAFFTYAGNDGGGDPGVFIARDTKVDNVMKQIRGLEEKMQAPTMPTFVFYTVDASSGTDSLKRDIKPDYLVKHYKNLFSLLAQLEGYRDARHPVPATVVLNPDFLGELHKQCSPTWCPVSLTTPINVKESLQTAISELGLKLDIPQDLLGAQQSFPEYVQSLNWIFSQAGPNITFGWQDNVWAGDGMGHGWLHKSKENAAEIQRHVDTEAAFWKRMKVYTGDAERDPDFIAFDKYERDTFQLADDRTLPYVNSGVMYNAQDMDVYMQYVKGMSRALGNQPTMLWQIPGGHLQVEGDIDARGNNASSEADYILGNPALKPDLSNLQAYIKNAPLSNAGFYDTRATTVGDYLMACPSGDKACLQTDHLAALKEANVFAVLWGGGSTTGVAGLSSALDDNGWLFGRIKAHGLNNGDGCQTDCEKPLPPGPGPGPQPVPEDPSCADDIGASGYVKWCDAGVFNEGDKTDLDGQGYEAKWWTRGFRPDTQVANEWDSPWKKLGGAKPDPVKPTPVEPIEPVEPIPVEPVKPLPIEPSRPVAPDACDDSAGASGFVKWCATTDHYNGGSKVDFNGKGFEAQWYAGKGEQPEGSSGVWKQISGDVDAAWSPEKVYTAGMTVVLNGVAYHCNSWNQNKNPEQNNGQYGQPWTRVGP